MRIIFRLALIPAVLALAAGSGAAWTAQAAGADQSHAQAGKAARATVGVYASGTTIGASSPAPAGATSSVSLAMPIGGVDDAIVLVHAAQKVSISSPTIASPLQLRLLFAHYVSVDGTAVPDALLPWDGTQRSTEHVNQPLWLQVTVPYGTAAGTYRGSVQVVADGTATRVPVTVTVYNVTLPRPGQVSGSLLTAFNVSPQSYGATVNKLYGIAADQSAPGLFSFLASYRISPNNWGYGNPRTTAGYTSDQRWWLDKSSQMATAVGDPRRFASMWIPISSNRWPKSSYVGGLSPYAPQTWCSYLRSVHGYWQQEGWLASYPYLWGMDEPGPKNSKTVSEQASVAHSCFPGSHVIVTGNPSPQNKLLWNGGSNDVDTWVVLADRYYGKYTTPSQLKKHVSHATQRLKPIDRVRRQGKQIWTYTYETKAHSTPSFGATERLTDPRVFVDWAALEGISGVLYGQGTTTYGKSNPLVSNDRAQGGFVLIYPGRDGPVPSARLEVLREGIEDWEILDVVRHRHGAKAVRQILGGLFSTTAKGTKLGCTVGCPLKTRTPFSWPRWSHDAATPGKLATMRAKALAAAS